MVTLPASRLIEDAQFLTAHSGVSMRHINVDDAVDQNLIATIYASTRTQEMRMMGWSQNMAENFLRQQYAAQEVHYAQQYPQLGRVFLQTPLATAMPAVIGRLYWTWLSDGLRVVDISLLERSRGQGWGGRVILALKALAHQSKCPVVLHVSEGNPAQHLYLRMGFRRQSSLGIYQRMVCDIPYSR